MKPRLLAVSVGCCFLLSASNLRNIVVVMNGVQGDIGYSISLCASDKEGPTCEMKRVGAINDRIEWKGQLGFDGKVDLLLFDNRFGISRSCVYGRRLTEEDMKNGPVTLRQQKASLAVEFAREQDVPPYGLSKNMVVMRLRKLDEIAKVDRWGYLLRKGAGLSYEAEFEFLEPGLYYMELYSTAQDNVSIAGDAKYIGYPVWGKLVTIKGEKTNLSIPNLSKTQGDL